MNHISTLLRACLLSLVLLALPSASTTALAQAPDVDQVEQADRPNQAQRQKRLERMRLMRSWKLTEVLELDEATGKRLFAVLDGFDERLMQAHQALRQSERALRQGLRRDASEAELEAMTDQVLARKRALDELRIKQFEEAGATLDARRRAKLLLFIPRFEKELRRKLHKRREDRRKNRRTRPNRQKRGQP
jgi:hypothetical protein